MRINGGVGAYLVTIHSVIPKIRDQQQNKSWIVYSSNLLTLNRENDIVKNRSMGTMKDKIGIAVYLEEDWEELRKISSDVDKLEKNWGGWVDNKNKLECEMYRNGISFEEVFIDLDELKEYCKSNNMEINSKARSAFVADKMRMKYH